MPKKIERAEAEWNCGRDNPQCLLHVEYGAACRNSIRAGSCHRTDASIPGGVAGIVAMLPRPKRVPANDVQVLAVGTN